MSTTRIAVTFISVQAAKPTYSYENPQFPPLEHLLSRVLVRAALPSLPLGSVIVSATLRVNQAGAWAGSNTLFVQRNFETWTNKATWANKPSLGDTAHSQTQVGTSADTWWDLDVSDHVQGMYAKTKNNWGWSLYTTSATRRNVVGSTAAAEKPHLVIVYEPPAKTPTGLSPAGGSVSVVKPVLTFNTEGETTAIQVQVDAAQDGVSPDFDSGSVAATAGVLDLADTAYAGLSDGSTTSWRARHQTAAGWSAYSPWVTFSRNDLDAVTMTAPAATVADPSPPFAWTFAGTQSAWQADLLNLDDQLLASSGRVSGADTAWTPPDIVRQFTEYGINPAISGLELRARIRVWDDVVRIATPGVAAYSEDSQDFTVVFDGDVDPMDTLDADQTFASPGVILSGTRAEGIPDEVAVLHDGVMVARLLGGDVFTTSTDFEFTDWWAPMGKSVEITVVAIVNSEFADASPSVTITPQCAGLWLVDPATDTGLVLWGNDQGSWGRDDLAAVHQLASGLTVRRRLAGRPLSGSASGTINDMRSLTAAAALAAFETFRANDAGTVYQLVAGQMNIPVYAGDFLDFPTPMENHGNEVHSRGQFNWWGV